MIESAGYRGTVVVIPTRNRAWLAKNAIRSVLDQPVDDLRILVSDNSVLPDERRQLEAFCAESADPRLHYVRPPSSLAMAAHWDWALQHALAIAGASHVTYLTDRMMFRRHALKEVTDLGAAHPDRVISYNHDRIRDASRPICVDEYPATGKLFQVQTSRLIWLVSQMIFHHGLPRMLNCIVPAGVLARIRTRFGSVFSSIAPDFNFCVRCLEIEDVILFLDSSPLVHYALDRSNGAVSTRGESSIDTLDFAANLPVDDSIRNYATPIPSLITCINAAVNEYLIHQRATGSRRFVAINLERYLRANAGEIHEVRDPERRAAMMRLLEAQGYRENGSAATGRPARQGVRRAVNTLKRGASRLRRRFGSTSAARTDRTFRTLEEALDYARNSRGNLKGRTSDADLLQGREV